MYPVRIFSSVLSKTRSGGFDMEKRLEDEHALPVRVPVYRHGTIDISNIVEDMNKREYRQIRAAEFRKNLYKKKMR